MSVRDPLLTESRLLTKRRDSQRIFKLATQPLVDPAESLATDDLLRRRLAAVPDQGGLIRIYGFAGELLSIGRHHAVPADLSPADLNRLHRRLSGGRNVPFGDGFVGLSIVLPHRSGLVSDEPLALAPHQVLNRCVRGLLEGLKSVGIPAFYPGRDLVTVDRRSIAMVSFDVGADGGLVFEAVIAVSRDFAARVEPPKGVTEPQRSADEATKVKDQLGVDLAFSDIADVLARGYAQQFDLSFETFDIEADVPYEKIVALAHTVFEKRRWMETRMVSADLKQHAVTAVMLGGFEAHVALAPDGRLGNVLLSGDIIANSTAIETIERKLKGCRADRMSIDAVVAETLATPGNFILGIDADTIATTILQAL